MNVQLLSPAELRSAAQQALRRTDVDRHWAVVASVLHRITEERLFTEYGFETGEAWAENELGLERWEYLRLLQLGRLVVSAGETVAPARWRELTQSKAALLVRVKALGAELDGWVAKAAEAKTTETLRQQVVKALGAEVWLTWKIRVPASLMPLIDAALVQALPDALGDPTAPPARAHDPDVAFRCLERILVSYVQPGGEHGQA